MSDQAEAEIITREEGETIAEIIKRHSCKADIVFLGLQDPPPGSEAEYAQRMQELAAGLRTTVFVRNASEFAGKLI